MKENGISRLETLVRETVEGSFGRLFGTALEPVDVATQLVQILEESAFAGDTNMAYDVVLHPEDHQALVAQNPQFVSELADAAWQMGRRYGLCLSGPPSISIVENRGRRRHSFRIRARDTGPEAAGLETTQVAGAGSQIDRALSAVQALDAFLIVQGRRHVPLTKPLITIGRRPDNDIVLDSAAVSRQHAQIRWRFDRFVLYDVSNRGRTQVNGDVVAERVLQAGDVIALSDALLIYAEGNERGAGGDAHNTDTQVNPAIRP